MRSGHGGRRMGAGALALLVGCLAWQAASAGARTEPEPSPPISPTLVYVSDYFSFIGADGQGHVAFALDNNRGRDGDEYQAEHFLVLHDEVHGWVDLAGNGRYPNRDRRLTSIPDSAFFQFEGAPRSGITITSPRNDLILRVDPLPERLSRSHAGGSFWMGSAPAVLEWAGRRLEGRVIYEYLYKPAFNRLTRTYVGLWNDFQGLYLSIDGTGDLYLHSQDSEQLAPLTGALVGFAVIDGQLEELRDLAFTVERRRFTLGLYRWPAAWHVRWKNGATSTIEVSLSERKVLANWIIGGFAMGIVKGEVRRGERTCPFYGLAELIM